MSKMKQLINKQGKVEFGLFDSPVDEINYKEYQLTTPMGMNLPGLVKKIAFNQFAFFGITGPEFIIGMAVVDLKYLANGFLYIYDRKNGNVIEDNKITIPFGRKIFISPTPEQVSCGFSTGKLSISIQNNRISAKSKHITLDMDFDTSDTHPIRLCSRAGYKGWVYTQKTAPIKVSGVLVYEDRRIPLSSPGYMGFMDWTAGYMRRETFWNWAASAATLPDGRSFGLNLSCGVNETSFTENAFWIDGKMTKLTTVNFQFNPENFYDQWEVKSSDGKVDLIFKPEQHREENVNAAVIATRFTQLMGTFKGSLKTDDGQAIQIDNSPGWAEDHYAKW